MSFDDENRPGRGAYTPPTDDDLPFRRNTYDPRGGGRNVGSGGGKAPPVTLIVSGVVLLVLIIAVIFFYRSGMRASTDAPPAVGQAVGEHFAIDPESGQPVCGSLMDYCLPRADTLPSFATQIVEVLSPTNPLGIKAGGEGGTTPALAVIVSAVLDALRPLGVQTIDMPVTPLAIWRAIHSRTGA